MRPPFTLLAALQLAPTPVAAQDGSQEDSAAYVASRAHADAHDSSVLGLYNVTVPGAEVDALATPSGGGFEYWPYVYDEQTNTHPSPYPDDVQWGFDAGSAAAQKCIKLSWHVWRYVLANRPVHLAAMSELDDAPSGYYHWNNDYTRARTENLGFRHFWHYGRPNGLLKWISHTKRDGSCHHPTVEAIDRWAYCEIQRLQNTTLQCSGHS